MNNHTGIEPTTKYISLLNALAVLDIILLISFMIEEVIQLQNPNSFFCMSTFFSLVKKFDHAPGFIHQHSVLIICFKLFTS